jgi:heme/copper-type cytochrome/quinol oxidase subunit 2
MVQHPRRRRPSRFTRPFRFAGVALLALAVVVLVHRDRFATHHVRTGRPDRRSHRRTVLAGVLDRVAIFVIVQGAIIFAVIFFRDRPGRPEPKQTHGNAKLEVTWTVIPALILAGIAIPTVRGVFDLTECSDDAMTVEIIGHQWWFEYQYPDHGIETANVLVMPAGEPVCAVMTSDDVLHNFWIPALNGKRYLVPGQTTLLPPRLRARRVLGSLRRVLRSLPLADADPEPGPQPDDFDAWVLNQQQPRRLSPPKEPRHGTASRSS